MQVFDRRCYSSPDVWAVEVLSLIFAAVSAFHQIRWALRCSPTISRTFRRLHRRPPQVAGVWKRNSAKSSMTYICSNPIYTACGDIFAMTLVPDTEHRCSTMSDRREKHTSESGDVRPHCLVIESRLNARESLGKRPKRLQSSIFATIT